MTTTSPDGEAFILDRIEETIEGIKFFYYMYDFATKFPAQG